MAYFEPSQFKTKNNTTVTLRSPLKGEGEKIIRMVKRNLETSLHTLTQPDEFKYTAEQEDDLLEQYYKSSGKIMIVPYLNDEPIGMLDFATGGKRKNSHVGELGISILPEYRNQGIGYHMLKALLSWTQSTPNIEKVELRVHAKNTEAIGLYDKCGFKIEGRYSRGVKSDDGQYDDVVHMSYFVR